MKIVSVIHRDSSSDSHEDDSDYCLSEVHEINDIVRETVRKSRRGRSKKREMFLSTYTSKITYLDTVFIYPRLKIKIFLRIEPDSLPECYEDNIHE